MTDIEIPLEKDRHFRYRFFEALPGLLTWTVIALPIILSLFNPTLAAIFVLVYLLVSFFRVIALASQAIKGYRMMHHYEKLDWSTLLEELESRVIGSGRATRPKWHAATIKRLGNSPSLVRPSEVIHAVIIPTYNESRAVLEPTIQSLVTTKYDTKKLMLIIAYEERGGPRIKKLAHELIDQYGSSFMYATAVEHPDQLPNEIIGKGGNITYAGKDLEKYLARQKIDPLRVMVTTLDADNKPHKNYFGALTYAYSACPDPVRSAFQPVCMYTNNIWDAPAPMRVIATGNYIVNIVNVMRPHALRNFSSHSQPMAGLIETDFWSTRTIVEDGHQFWRSYFRFDGHYRVYPLYLPIYQDAVLSDKYIKTLRAQFIQLRRWTWGASDVAYIIDKGYFHKNKVPRLDLLAKLWRHTELNINWAAGPIFAMVAGYIPVLVNPSSFTANELPLLVSHIQNIAVIGALASVFLTLKTLPPKPARYKRHRSAFMIVQWVFLPATSLIYNSFAALYSQTRLMFGWYLDFDVTSKAVVTDSKKRII